MTMPRRFELNRREDLTGISGTGAVASGVVFEDGMTILRWNARQLPDGTTIFGAMSIWKSIAEMIAVHGHEGRTLVSFIDQ